ncbi:DUF1361 domain-containing protein [Microlunatus sp. GCM10028923]|uniref:DUF1361 domain-containing protein n=1 Tax=Microlunatus sp. GCM10028923 TaxID=3273400 RepID=UPI0036164113
MSLLVGNAFWMTWNTILALVPLLLAWLIFGKRERPVWLLIIGAAAFVVFLPNAPYVLTDVLHLPGDLAVAHGNPWLVAALLTQYLCLFAIGFGAYVVALVRLQRWLTARGVSRRSVIIIDLALHALCAVGIVIGRVFRFNSWDVVADPGGLLELVRIPQPRTVLVLLALFGILAVGAALARALPTIMNRARSLV